MRKAVHFFIFIVLFFSCSRSEGLDIYKKTMDAYFAEGASNADFKNLGMEYLAALEAEVALLNGKVEEALKKHPDLLRTFQAYHKAWVTMIRDGAEMVEEGEWWDLSTGVRDDGTNRGYARVEILTSGYWDMICKYQKFLKSMDLKDLYFAFPKFETIGGPLQKKPSKRKTGRKIAD